MRSDDQDAVTGDDVTVMVCAYNAAETIGATLASIAAQTVRPGRVLVLDDASTDDTADVARSWASRLPIEIVTHPEHAFVSSTRRARRVFTDAQIASIRATCRS